MYLGEGETCKKVGSRYTVTFTYERYHYELMENGSHAIVLSIKRIRNSRTKHAVEIN